MVNGIINVYKEKGFTSFDVVAKLKGVLHERKIGHTGTLDPEAEGVLPICVGCATRVVDMLTDRSKSYRAVLKLGVTTDTEDLTGEVLSRSADIPDEQSIKAAVMSFEGEYEQIPPMYSALKVNGRRLYELAREGKVVERKPRRVTIGSLLIENVDLTSGEVTFSIECSKGTYIRSLCRDIGEKLGCGGCMKSLVRTRVGEFELKDALTIGQIEEYADSGRLSNVLMDVDTVFKQYEAVHVREEYSRYIDNGNKLAFEMTVETTDREEGKCLRVYDCKGEFRGVYTVCGDELKPWKIFKIR